MKKYCDYCDLCEPGEFGAICHASTDEECPEDVYCDAEYNLHGSRLKAHVDHDVVQSGLMPAT